MIGVKAQAITLVLQAGGDGRISYDLCEELVSMIEEAKDMSDLDKVTQHLASKIGV